MSDILREFAIKNSILKIRSGSHLYGTNTPTSDEDYIGIFIPPVDYILGLKTVEEVDCGIISKDSNGKNTTDAVDFKIYELRKFVKLALQNNPNIIEILFVNKENIISINDIGQNLLDIARVFPCKEASYGFLGYAKAQKHKMIIKKDNFEDLLEGYKILEKLDPKMVMGQVYDKLKNSTSIFQKKGTGVHIHIGDINFEPGVYVLKAMRIIKDRLDRATNRVDLILKHGYDCYSEDTEFLTTAGWKKYSNISNEEKLATVNPFTFQLEFQAPYDRVCKQYNGKMYDYIGANTKFCVTLNHRMFLSSVHRSKKNNFSVKYERQNSDWSFIPLEKILKSNKSCFHCLTSISPKEEDNILINDDYINIVGLFCSEGSWAKFNKNGPRCVRICQTNHGKQIVFEIMDRISTIFGFKKYTYYREDKQLFETSWISHDKNLINKLKEDCGVERAKRKKLPSWILTLSKRQADILLSALVAGDGCEKNKFTDVYYTASNCLANDVQILALIAGRDSTVCGPYEYKNCFKPEETSITYQTIIYKEISIPKCIRISPNMKKNIRHNKKEDNRGGRIKDYNGNIVCFSVPNELLITRLNGKIAIQGNTKFGMHLIRLLREGIDLMQDGSLTFPLAYADELLDIRKGNWKVEKLLNTPHN